jgi:Leucine Rich repeat
MNEQIIVLYVVVRYQTDVTQRRPKRIFWTFLKFKNQNPLMTSPLSPWSILIIDHDSHHMGISVRYNTGCAALVRIAALCWLLALRFIVSTCIFSQGRPISLFDWFIFRSSERQSKEKRIMQDAENELRRQRRVHQGIQVALADDSRMGLVINSETAAAPPPLTAGDARRIFHGLRETPRIHTLDISRYVLRGDAALNVFRNNLPLCTSLTTVSILRAQLGNDGLERLLPAFYNTSITKLHLTGNNIQGQRGGELLQSLLFGNNNILELKLYSNPIGPEGAAGIGRGLFYTGNTTTRLQKLSLLQCRLGNDGLANLLALPAGDDGMIDSYNNNKTLTDLNLAQNGIEGAEGGRQVTLLLQRFPKLKVLNLNSNYRLGPLGARAMAPGLTAAAASCLEELFLCGCRLGNDGVTNLVPDGQVNIEA